MSARLRIAEKLAGLLRTIDGSSAWNTDLHDNVQVKFKFWDEIDDYPSVFVNPGYELRVYEPGGVKWAHLSLTIRIYVQEEEPEIELEKIFEDIEKIIDLNGNMEYDTNKTIEDMRLVSIQTDEGVLSPIGVGEMSLQIMYVLYEAC